MILGTTAANDSQLVSRKVSLRALIANKLDFSRVSRELIESHNYYRCCIYTNLIRRVEGNVNWSNDNAYPHLLGVL